MLCLQQRAKVHYGMKGDQDRNNRIYCQLTYDNKNVDDGDNMSSVQMVVFDNHFAM